MSASNWSRCPKCMKMGEVRASELRETIANMYGKVSIEDFTAMQAELNSLEQGMKLFTEKTLREDYEIYGADDGEIEVTYAASCNECGLKVSFGHVHEIDLS